MQGNNMMLSSSTSNSTSSSSSSGDWSPFYCLPKAALTPAGLLQLDLEDNEVELIRRNSMIELRHEPDDGDDDSKQNNKNDKSNATISHPMAPCPRDVINKEWKNRTSSLALTIIVTTHRIVFNDSSSNNDHRFVSLSTVRKVQSVGGPSFQHPFATYKIILTTYLYGKLILAFLNYNSSNTTINSQIRPKDNRDAIIEQLEKAVSRKQWEQKAKWKQQQKLQQQQNKKRCGVGVDHVLNQHKLRHEHAKQLADTVITGSAEQLLNQAGELLQVIQKYTVLLQKYQSKGANNNGNNAHDDDDTAAQKLAGLLSDMGMTSALTKSQVTGSGAGSAFSFGSATSTKANDPSLQQYYELTARQIADFLLPRFQKQWETTGQGSGGMMTLTDIYCLFNRARGTNLISPEDLKQACFMLKNLNVGLTQRTFPSGVIVVQLDQLALDHHDNDVNQKRIVKICPTTALEASHVLKLSPLLAMEQLEEAERLGLLCRDSTMETVRFYPNKFVTEGW